jgi:N-methylhydantoinase A
LASDAIDEHLAKPLGIGVEEAAAGVIRLMEQKLLLAVQRLSTERGHDPKHFTLVAGGGAGPLHAASVGRTIGCRRVYIPRLSGAFCALGMLGADIRHDHVSFFTGDLDEIADADVQAMFECLAGEAAERLAREGFDAGATTIRHSLDLRYVGQQWDITVGVGQAFDRAAIRETFDIEHNRLFGHMQPGGAIGIMKARVTGVGALPSLAHSASETSDAAPEAHEHRAIWIDSETGWRETPVFDGPALRPGQTITGPALINEPTTTVLVGAGDWLAVDASGNYAIRVGRT